MSDNTAKLFEQAEERATEIFRKFRDEGGRNKGIWDAARRIYFPLLRKGMRWKNDRAAYHHALQFFRSNRWNELVDQAELVTIEHQPEKDEFTVNGNHATALVTTRTPRSLEEIIARFNVDKSVWRVASWEVNSWEQAAIPRAIGRSKSWSRSTTKPIITPLYQCKAKFVRIAPQAILFPEVRPIHVTVQGVGHHKKDSRGNIRRAIILPDVQCGFKRDHRTGVLEPFHDRAALDVALQIAAHRRPDQIVLLGDNLDLPEFSDKFVRSPEFYFTTQPAVAEFAWWLAQLRSNNKKAQIHWIEGNHDRRFLLSIINHNIASYDLRPADDLDGNALMSIERLCGLGRLNVEYHGPYPGGEIWINNNLRCHHGQVVRARSGSTVRAVAEDLRHSEVQGHVHRFEMATKTGWTREGPKTYMAFSPGTLARLDPGVVPAVSHRNNWQQGLAEVEYEEGNGFFNIYPIQIHSGKAIYNGIEWTSRPQEELIDRIEADLRSVRVH